MLKKNVFKEEQEVQCFCVALSIILVPLESTGPLLYRTSNIAENTYGARSYGDLSIATENCFGVKMISNVKLQRKTFFF